MDGSGVYRCYCSGVGPRAEAGALHLRNPASALRPLHLTPAPTPLQLQADSIHCEGHSQFVFHALLGHTRALRYGFSLIPWCTPPASPGRPHPLRGLCAAHLRQRRPRGPRGQGHGANEQGLLCGQHIHRGTGALHWQSVVPVAEFGIEIPSRVGTVRKDMPAKATLSQPRRLPRHPYVLDPYVGSFCLSREVRFN